MKNIQTTWLIVAAVSICWGCSRQEPADEGNKVRRVTVTEATVREIGNPVSASGKLASKTEVRLSFKTGGIIDNIRIKEGQRVSKGDILATLNLSEINARNRQAEEAFQKAVRDLDRVKNLYRDSVATLEQLQDAGTALEVARTNMEIARFNLKYSTIESPSDGEILMKLAEESEIVSAGQPVILFGSYEGGWIVRVSLTDRDMVRVQPGHPAELCFDAYPSAKFTAYVTEIGKAADPYTGTFEAELTLNAGKYALASGFVARVNILPPPSDSCLMVPVDALVEAEGNTGYLFVVTDSIAKKRKVSINRVADFVCITEGLFPEEKIVVEGAGFLSDGEKIAIVNPVK